MDTAIRNLETSIDGIDKSIHGGKPVQRNRIEQERSSRAGWFIFFKNWKRLSQRESKSDFLGLEILIFGIKTNGQAETQRPVKKFRLAHAGLLHLGQDKN